MRGDKSRAAIVGLIVALLAVLPVAAQPLPPVPKQAPQSASPSPAKSTPQTVPATDRVRIEYLEPKNPAHKPILGRLQASRVLEELREFLAPLRLLTPLTVRTMSCGQANAYYASGTVTMCYEFIEFLNTNVGKDSCEFGIVPEDAIIGQFVDILLHEVAHALFDVFRVPIFGREEDAADQLAAFILLQFGPDVARRTINATALLFRQLAERQARTREKGRGSAKAGDQTQFDMTEFASEHGAHAQRFYNVLCIAYGFSPELFGDFVKRGLLPPSRAGRCGSEYRQVAHAFRTLINPHLDLQQLLRSHRPDRQWLPPSPAKCG